MKTKILALVAAGLISMCSTAHAVPFVVTGTGQTDAFTFTNQVTNQDDPSDPNLYTLSAIAEFNVLLFNANTLQLEITLTNTTAGVQNGVNLAGAGGVNVHGLAWLQDPDATSVAFDDVSDLGIQAAFLEETFPGFQQVDICASTSDKNCGGGSAQEGILIGQSDIFQVTLTGNFSNGSVTIDPAYVRYTGMLGSFDFQNTPPPPAVPEPSTMLLLGSGLLGLGVLRRRSRNS